MAKYRKRPVVIEAFQWNGHNIRELSIWAACAHNDGRKQRGEAPPPSGSVDLPIAWINGTDKLEIHTLEGTHVANPGDWIICGVAGEYYPCKDLIFRATYEAA